MLPSFLAGLGLGLTLIIAIGAQNLFVLRQGLRREHVFAVAAVCAASDAALIALGVSGLGLALTALPWLVEVIRWAGALFLLGYGLLAARRAIRPSGHALAPSPETEPAPGSAGRAGTAVRSRLAPVLLTCLALTWLNPHVYLDTVFFLGLVASGHGEARWVFAAGAMLGSILWFFGLAFGARYLSRWLATPRAWRILDAIIAVVMIALAVSLVLVP
ncbi:MULTISPECIES: LysE/ArgO family amino acid transporter [Microbacterium]|uniref:Amino acid transporter n=1 Tax=Microbacterium wangchenii TaxID=2541726 RepID=A0ABX5SU50_9MICO|nr:MULTISPECIES: LysE/ArgO family amino acid transporter [Microbacterium]MCK6067341.1 LysE/ArgO family amino acid transporter [Microbacterium sp. EYE_512]QBR89718.1 amino acid transporter [Microbacterium wangchenii]TXK16684.1 amino acid transporter [Microbacterium wangchenii]